MTGRLVRPAGDLRTLLDLGAVGDLPDDALLDRFEARADEAAFEALVRRHGPLVLRVARGRLGSEADARDAFQATFWLLARRSRSIRDRAALAGWLAGVAARVSARAAVDAARRRARERRAARPVEDSTRDPARRESDLAPALRAEVDRLPPKDRAAVLLCDLEGLTYAEAAARLGCRLGAFKARLSRARGRLRARLIARGLAPADRRPASPRPLVVPIPLVRATCRVALANARSPGLPGTLGSTFILVPGVSRPMLFGSISIATVLASVALTVAIRGDQGGDSTPTDRPAGSAPATPPRSVPPQPEPPPVVEPAAGRRDQDPRGETAGVVAPVAAPPPVGPRPAPSPRVDPVVRQAREIAESIADPDARARLLLGLGRLQTRLGDRGAARETLALALGAAERIGPDPDGFHPRLVYEVGLAQAKNGDGEVARQTFDRAIPLIQQLPPAQQDRHWALLLATEGQVQPREACRATVEAYRRFLPTAQVDLDARTRFVLSWGGFLDARGFHPAARLVATRAMLGDFAGAIREAEAEATFDDLRRFGASDRLRRIAARYPAWRGIAEHQAWLGIAQALRPEDGPLIAEVLNKARASLLAASPVAELRDPMASAVAYSSRECLLGLIDVEARLGRFDDALDLMMRGPDPILLPHTLITIALGQAAAGDRPAARRTIREATILAHTRSDESQRADATIQAAATAARVGDLEMALDQAETLGLWLPYRALEKILRERRAAGDEPGARQTLQRMEGVIRRCLAAREGEDGAGEHGKGSRVSWLVRLAAATGAPVDIEAAREAVATMSTGAQQGTFLEFLATAEASAGGFEAALKTADQIRDGRTRAWALLRLAEVEVDRSRPDIMEDQIRRSAIFAPPD